MPKSKETMDELGNEITKRRGGFLSNLNRSFRVASGKRTTNCYLNLSVNESIGDNKMGTKVCIFINILNIFILLLFQYIL